MTTGAELLAAAQRAIGKPYVYGDEGPDAFDCSGLVQWAGHQVGLNLPRVTSEQVKVGTAVQRSSMQPGDLIFSTWGNESHPGHVGIYAGGGRILSAPQPGQNVGYSALNDYYWSHVDGIRRVTNSTASGGGSGDAEASGGGSDGGGGGLVGAVVSIADAVHTMATGAVSGGQLAAQLLKLALPSNLMRLAMGVGGVWFIFLGIVVLMREAKA